MDDSSTYKLRLAEARLLPIGSVLLATKAMGVVDLHDLELNWPSPYPTDVIVTGTFDQWTSSIHLVKGHTGFFGTVKVPYGQKVTYKFIVDGHWQCRDDWPQEDDGHGNINNVLQTPEKPQAVLPAIHNPPPRLSISLEDAQSHDVEAMVTAVEVLPPAESAIVEGLLPPLIPHISVEGLGVDSSADTLVQSMSKLDTAVATEGTVPPALKTPAELGLSNQAPFSSVVPILLINDRGVLSLPPTDRKGEAYDSHGFATDTPIQSAEGLISPLVPETAEEALSVPLESTVPQSNPSPQGAQNASTLANRIDVPSAPRPTAKQPEVGPGTAIQGRREQATGPASIGQSSSTLPSSTLTHKKRRSLFTKIKHMFDRDKNKQERREGTRH